MGLHNSGTHALVECANAFFNIDVQPAMAKFKDGIVVVGDFSLWKHTVPLAPLQLPWTTARGRVALLLAVRDVQ